MLQARMRDRLRKTLPALAAVLAFVVPVTTLAQPQQQPPPVVDAQIYVQAPVVAQPMPPPVDAPRTIPYDEGGAIPPGYTLREKARIGLVIGGSVALGVLYLTSLMIYALADAISCIDGCGDNDLWPLSIPVIGPFVAIGTTNAERAGVSFLVLDGIGQSAGLAMLILGVVAKKKVWVRNDLGALHLAPLVTASGGRGLSLAGNF